ncbi:extracellular solute-binding protein [Caldilinea sp.]|uniref:extracellular solute-binding protein n=1 Tax=Caldilinea sp. TaxID=2293560 RepID=UPI002BAADD9B|nr:extracellular solute-binding protein [Caldilinea sp.]
MSNDSRTLNRRTLLKLLGGVAATGMVAACAPAVAPATGGGAAAPAQADITIRFWNVWGAAREELMNQIIARFEEKNPGIKVQNLVQPFERREENLFTALASGDPPEVLMSSRAEVLRFANDGLILLIDGYVTANNLDLSRFYPSEIGNFYWKDQLYSMPMPTGGGVTSLTLVNYDVLRAAGKADQVPATWAELEEMAKEFTETDDKGIVKIGATVGTGASDFFAWLYCNGGSIYSDDLSKVTFDNEQGVQTLEWMVNFTNEINGGVQNVTDFFAGPGEATEAQPWYNDAQLVNFPNVSIFFHMQTYKPDMQWDMGLRPYNASNADAKSQGLSGEAFAWGYVVPNAVPEARREAAFKWLQEITYEEESGGWFVMQQGRPSPIKAVNEDPSFSEVNPHWDKVLQSLESDVSVQILPIHAQVRDAVTQGVQAAFFGDASPADALAQAAQQAQGIVDDYWSQEG